MDAGASTLTVLQASVVFGMTKRKDGIVVYCRSCSSLHASCTRKAGCLHLYLRFVASPNWRPPSRPTCRARLHRPHPLHPSPLSSRTAAPSRTANVVIWTGAVLPHFPVPSRQRPSRDRQNPRGHKHRLLSAGARTLDGKVQLGQHSLRSPWDNFPTRVADDGPVARRDARDLGRSRQDHVAGGPELVRL